MFSGYYTIASGLLASQRNVETIGNNLINSQTPGYRAERIVNSAFEQELMTRRDSSGNTVLGDGIGATAVVVDDSLTVYNPGLIKETGSSFDVAINGEGFFNIRGADGKTYLTRSGEFDMDREGYLIMPGVGRVLGKSGEILVRTSDITVKEDGTIMNSAGNVLGQLHITAPEDYSTLERTENGLFISEAPLNDSNNFQLLQNNLELSNVQMNTELTNLIAAQRALQNCASALKTVDSLNRKAATQIAAI